VQGDVRKLEDLDRLYAKVASDGRRLDVVDSVKLADITIESFNHNFDVNARGVLFTVQKSLPLLNNGASVILTSTIASLRGFPGRSAYAASKIALRSHARTWTMELKDRGIRVNTITPGPCDTPLIDVEVHSPEAATAVRAKHAANILLGRMARPEEIAAAMLFLASEDSSFVAGSELLVDGGMCSVWVRPGRLQVRSTRPATRSPDRPKRPFRCLKEDSNATDEASFIASVDLPVDGGMTAI
jgi:NAD(P)-dependent dehydrogenase (short-subunit alcohol dehydrogenase family)